MSDGDVTGLTLDLGGRAAVVTGASSGIGAEIAVAMASAGACLVLVGRNRDRVDEAARRVAETGAEQTALYLDVTDPDAPGRVVDTAVERFGTLDILVHAAGVFWPKPFLETSAEDLDGQWMTNVRAPYAITQAAIPLLRGGGVVVFISSIAGFVGFPGSSAYCATKGAVESLCRALTTEFAADGIRFNCVAPGNIRTPMNEHLLADPDYERRMLEATPAGRVGEVGDIAPAVVFLASDAARYAFGTSLVVDGGWLAQ